MRVGDDITRETEIVDVEIGDHGAGPNVVIKVRDSISSPRGLSVVEERDFLSHAENGPGQMWPAPEIPDSADWSRAFESNPVQIFRMLAVRHNSHRIHYDRDFTTQKEGFAGLVVPVTLVTFLMMELCRAETPDRPLSYFSHRSEKPVIDLSPYSISAKVNDADVALWSTDYEGDLAVTAKAKLGG